MLFQSDGALRFGFRFRPEPGREHRKGNPAKPEGQIVQPFEVMRHGDGSMVQNREEIFRPGFDEPGVLKRLECLAPHRAGAALPGGITAIGLHLLHDCAPGAARKLRILRGQTGLEKQQVETGVGHRLTFDFEQTQRGRAILGVERLLFSGPGVLHVERATTAK